MQYVKKEKLNHLSPDIVTTVLEGKFVVVEESKQKNDKLLNIFK